MVYDAIVLGVGGMGSAALWHLARRGCKVLGIEQFGVAHDRGSSHGGSRLIRRAYFEHPDYVPLVSRAYTLWAELEEASGKKLFHRTGLFLAGPRLGPLIDGVLEAANAHNIQIETVAAADAARRFPGLRAAPGMTILYEADAGFLEVENCVRAHVDQALSCGAQLQLGVSVRGWAADKNGVRVDTDSGIFTAARLVLCAGAWSSKLLGDLGIRLTIRRKVVVWFETCGTAYRVDSGCPVFCFDTPSGFFYGFPSFDGCTVKVGEHSGGEPVATPEQLDRHVHESDLEPLEQFIAKHLPAAQPRLADQSVCMYTMTPDEHFIIDRHPAHENVIVACGFSGHGFKFASVVGSILADLVTHGGTAEPAGFLKLSRLTPR
jgi:sarcosine oxidase